MPSIGFWEILIIALIIVLLFGAKKLPDAARSVGRSMRIFKSEVKEMGGDDKDGKSDAPENSGHQAAPRELPQPHNQAQDQLNPQQNLQEQTPQQDPSRSSN